jgi:hypothetical protein
MSAIERPKPAPPCSRERALSARPKRSKKRGMSSEVIPIPVSDTEACANPSRDTTFTLMEPPLGVYFAALSMRIKSARRSASASAWMGIQLGGTSMLNPTLRFCARRSPCSVAPRTFAQVMRERLLSASDLVRNYTKVPMDHNNRYLDSVLLPAFQ